MPRNVVLTALLSMMIFAQSAIAADRGTAPVDQSGRPVKDASARINYLPAQDVRGRSTHQAGPRNGSPADVSYVPSTSSTPVAPPHEAAALPALPFQAGLMREDGVIGSSPQGLGTAGIFAVDVNSDGTDEILVAHSMLWYVLELDRPRNTWVQRYFGEKGVGGTFGGGGVLCARIGDLNGDGRRDLVILTGANAFESYDLASGALNGTQTPGVTGIKRFALANLDGGQDDEIVAINENDLVAIKNGVLTPLWTVTGAKASDLAIGNMDQDPALEIALARGTASGWVIDASTRVTQFDYSLGFGDYIAAGDIDGDGMAEIASAELWGDYMAFDVDTSSLKWSAYNFNTSAIRIADTDGDNAGEVLVGDAQWGDVQVLEGTSGAQRYAIANPEHSVSFIAVGDVLGTCKPRIIWGAGFTSSGEDHLYIANPATRTIEWENLEVDGPFAALAAGDSDADGRTELIRVSANSRAEYDGALVFVNDFHHRVDEYTPSLSTNDGWMITRTMVLEQLDNDAALEYVLNDSSTYSGRVSAFDAVTHQVQWTSDVYDGEYVSCITSADADGDGTIDILVGTGREHTGATGTYVRVYNGKTGARLWQSPSLGDGFQEVTSVRAANIDGTGNKEILALSGRGVTSFDGVTHQLNWTHALTSVSALETGDVNGDGVPEYIVGTSTGVVTAYNGATKAQVFTVTLTGTVRAIRLADVDGDGTREMVVAYGGEVSYVAVIQLSDASVLWQSPGLVGAAGWGDSLLVQDVDNDGRVEIVVGTAHSVRVYEYASAAEAEPPIYPTAAVGVQTATSAATSCCVAVDLSWVPANDSASPPMTYNIYRSATSGFAPGNATLIGKASLTSFRDRGVVASQTYHYIVRAVDRFGNEEQNSHEVSVVPNSITAAALPATKNVCVGAQLLLSATATGGGTLTYRWAKNGTPIANATQSTYLVQSATSADAGSYTCVISDSCGSSVTVGPVVVTVEEKHGDVNRDCVLTQTDLAFMADNLLGSGPAPPGNSGDTDRDGTFSKMDFFVLFGYLYNGGPTP